MVFQAKEGVDVEKTVTDTQFKIATNSKLFSILSDSIYTRKIDAVIRELCCNAFDAQVEARQTRPFQVTLPDGLTPEFRVRDFGLGLSETDMQMYTTYGESTKSGSNAYIGAFGIGAKSPFAYTNTFNVTSYHDGMARSYSMFVEQGVPRMTKLGEIPSDEPSGLDVFFSVEGKDIEEFKEKAKRICALMSDKLEVLNVPDVWREEFRLEIAKYKWEKAPYLGDGYMTSNLEVDTSCKQDILNIVQGNVTYEMHLHDITELLRYSLGGDYNKVVSRVEKNFYIVGTLKVPNGTFVPHPSRERLTFDEFTKASIKTIFQKIFKYYVIDSVDRVMDGAKSYFELHNRLKGYPKLVTSNPKIAEFSCPDMIDPPVSNPTQNYSVANPRNYDEWRKREFSCIQVQGGSDKYYRFKVISNMTMYGELIDRIYYSSKYPLYEDHRYRVIHDKQQAEAERVIILTGDISRMFTEADKAQLIDVQALPKLTPQELAALKKNVALQTGKNERVTREEVSFITVSESIWLSQKTFEQVTEFATKHPVYWIASNRRYEITLCSSTYKLKTKQDLFILRNNCEFILDYLHKTNGLSKNDTATFGIAVLPDDHELRGSLPNFCETVPDIIRQTVFDFLGKNYYELDKRDSDRLFPTLIDTHRSLFMNLIAGLGDIEDFFISWFADGMPEWNGIRVKRWSMPFGLLPDGEAQALCKEYQSNKNVHRASMHNVYIGIASRGYPIMNEYTWGCSDRKTINDVIFYLQEKNKLLVQNKQDGN